MQSDVERRVYAEVREQAKGGARATIASVSKKTGVPKSSVANVAVKLGYQGWVDMTSQLVRYYSALDRDGAVADSVNVVAEALERARGSVVLLDAIGDSEICLDYVLYRLCELGFRAMPYTAGVVDAVLAKDIAATGSTGDGVGDDCSERQKNGKTMQKARGLLIVLNESGMSMVPACTRASSAGMEIVAITASHDTPVSKLSQVNVVIKNNKSTPEAYAPNYFTAGVFVFMERVLAACSAKR